MFNLKDSSFDSEGFGEITFKNELIAQNQTNAKEKKKLCSSTEPGFVCL